MSEKLYKPILQISRTETVSFVGGIYKVRARHGALVRGTEPGTIIARFLQDPPGAWREIKVKFENQHDFLPFVILEIRQEGTTLSADKILVGYNE